MTIQTAEFSADNMIVQPAPGTAGVGIDTLLNGTPSCSTALADMPDEARLYLRHVEGGESIRSLAREAGCHASTILRRIRRFETRRDDPLVDQALSTAGKRRNQHNRDQTLRILRRLSEAGAEMVVMADMPKAMIRRGQIRTAILDRSLAESFALKGWVALTGDGRMTRYVIAPAGREALRSLIGAHAEFPRPGDFADAEPIEGPAPGMAENSAPFRPDDSQRVWGQRVITDPEDGTRRRARVNLAENPLLVLARRRDINGQPFLNPEQVAAGERIREDFELAQMGPRVTQNWDRFMTAGIDESSSGSGFGGGSERARDRVGAALRELGPGMGDLVLRVCCFLEGIESTERKLGWSARSGKIVLRLALERLHRHYVEKYGVGSPMIG